MIFKLVFAILWDTRNVRSVGPMPSDKCMVLLLDYKVPVYVLALDTSLQKPKKVQTKVFLFHIFTQVQNDIHSIF